MARRLVVPKTARSEVWNYFGFEADEYGTISDAYRRFVWCRLCDTQLMFSGNTTNLSAHIARCRKMPRLLGEEPQTDPQVVVPSLENAIILPGLGTLQKVNFNDMEQEIIVAPDFQNQVSNLTDNEQDSPDECEPANGQEQGSSFESSGSEQHYCLKWKYHQENQQSMFSTLLQKESFCDVTIACEEKLLRAHKLLLSACSSYFEKILSIYKDQNPIIILKDVRYEDMSALVQFMYKGEINVEQSQLPTLLETADLLKIKGLSDIYGGSHQTEPSNFAENANSSGEFQYIKTEDQSNDCQSFDTSKSGPSRRRPMSVSEVGDHKPVKIHRRNIGAEVPQIVKAIQPLSPRDNSKKKADYMKGVIRLPDFLKGHGTYQQFWKKPWVTKALKAVSDREMTLRKCSDMLGVGYNILYSRYRQLHGCLKEGSFESQGTSRSYTLKIVGTPSENEQEGKIILRRHQLSPAAALSVANNNERSSDQEIEPILSMKLEPVDSISEQYECEVMQDVERIVQDPEKT